MKRKHWIGGVLLVMALWGMTGCGKAEAPPAGQMVDGPGMMYTPEDQSPFAGTWQSRDGSIVMEVESRGQFEASGILPGMWQPSQMRRADICTFR